MAFISANLLGIIVFICGIVMALLKLNYILFNRVIKSEVENSNLRLRAEIMKDINTLIEKECRHEVGNQINLILMDKRFEK